jgi:hypothetical protein
MKARKVLLILGCLLTVVDEGTLVWSGPIPSPLRGVTVSAAVQKDEGTGIFTYRYRVFNPATNDGKIWSVDIEISRSPSEAVLRREGLVNGPRYMRHSSEDAFQRVPMVPVGISAPEGWTSDLGFDARTPPRGFAGWGSIDEPFRILPGQIREGFQLTSYGLPGIRTVEIQPDIDYDKLPDQYFGDPEKTRKLRDRLISHTESVGPKAPPQAFVPLEFLNYLITLLHDSRQQGWVREKGIHQSLLAKLTSVKRKLKAAEGAEAKNILNTFLNEVQASSCPAFTCPGNPPLTSEAYALLFFNGQYLWGRLP